jgi:hypothetical protein
MSKFSNILALTSVLISTIAPMAMANEAEPGWTEWQPSIEGEEKPYSAGFSNMELGGYMDFEYGCKTKAEEEKTKPDFFYRLSDLVAVMGTGLVEQKCTIHDQSFMTYFSQAVKADLDYPVCLEVNTDVGNGVVIRKENNVDAEILGSLANGTQFNYPHSPAIISTDNTGRRWLYLDQDGNTGWASIAANPGDHINFQLCPSS